MSSDNPSGADNQQETASAGSSETVRRASHLAKGDDETVRSPWRHGEDGRNDRPATLFRVEVTAMPKVGRPGHVRPGSALRKSDLAISSWLFAGNSEYPALLVNSAPNTEVWNAQ